MSSATNQNRLASGTQVIISEDSSLVKEFPCLKGVVGTVALSYSEPCTYTGNIVVLYSVKMPAGVFMGRSVRVSEYEIAEVVSQPFV